MELKECLVLIYLNRPKSSFVDSTSAVSVTQGKPKISTVSVSYSAGAGSRRTSSLQRGCIQIRKILLTECFFPDTGATTSLNCRWLKFHILLSQHQHKKNLLKHINSFVLTSWDHLFGRKMLRDFVMTMSWQTMTLPFQGSSSSVSLCRECSSWVLLWFRATEAWWSGWNQLTQAVCCKRGNRWGEGLIEVVCHAASQDHLLMTKKLPWVILRYKTEVTCCSKQTLADRYSHIA